MHKCENCCWGNKCFCADGCADYSPLDDANYTLSIVECERTAYHEAWFLYIDEYND